MIRAVIFDFDGVLMDTMPAHFRTWSRLAYFLGFDLDQSLVDEMRGGSREKSLQLVLDAGGIEASDEQKAFYANMKDTWFQYEIKQLGAKDIFPGAVELVKSLDESGISCAVASSSRNARQILEHLGLAHLFEAIVDARNVKVSKPDPAVFHKALEKLDTKASETVVIEDGQLGVDAAKSAGCYCIGIDSAAKLRNADVCVAEIQEISKDIITNIQVEAD